MKCLEEIKIYTIIWIENETKARISMRGGDSKVLDNLIDLHKGSIQPPPSQSIQRRQVGESATRNIGEGVEREISIMERITGRW